MGSNKRLIAEITQGDSLIMTIDENLINVEFSSLDRGRLTSVAEWGIYANRGSITFVDKKGLFNSETINSTELLGYYIKFYLAYKVSTKLIATFRVKSASINEDTREVSVEFSSRLEELQKVNMSKGISSYEEMSAEQLTESVSSELERDFGTGIYFGEDLSGLQNVSIYAPYLLKGESYWRQINKICQASMSRVFDDKYGNPCIAGEYPDRDPIIVKPHNIIGIPDSGFVRTPNICISVFNTEKSYWPHTVEDAHVVIPVNGGVDASSGAYIDSISNCNYEIFSMIGYYYANISKDIDSKYLILGNQDIAVKGIRSVDVFAKDSNAKWAKIYSEKYNDSANIHSEEPKYSINFGKPVVLTGQISSAGTESFLGLSTSFSFDFEAQHFIINGSVDEKVATSETDDFFYIPSNELIQSRSSFDAPATLAQGILNRVHRRYGDGIECFEIECLFNDYYDEQGNKIIDGEDISNHFEKYDVIIPYVKKMGQTVPLRKNKDGTPKKFRIIGISYIYDGLLRQKLQVQEDKV